MNTAPQTTPLLTASLNAEGAGFAVAVLSPCKKCTSRYCGFYCRFYIGKRAR